MAPDMIPLLKYECKYTHTHSFGHAYLLYFSMTSSRTGDIFYSLRTSTEAGTVQGAREVLDTSLLKKRRGEQGRERFKVRKVSSAPWSKDGLFYKEKLSPVMNSEIQYSKKKK